MKGNLLLSFTAIALTAKIFISCQKSEVTSAGASVTALNCSSASFSTAATSGVAYSASATVPYEGGNGGTYEAGTAVSSTGVTGLTAVL